MGVSFVRGTSTVVAEISNLLKAKTEDENRKLAKAILAAAEKNSHRVLSAGGKYSGQTRGSTYAKDWSMRKSGDGFIVGNVNPAALVHEFGSTGGSQRRSGRKRQREHRGGGGRRVRNITPKKVLARAISIAFSKTEGRRRKKKSLDGKGLR